MTDETVEDRFWSKVDRRGPDECWEWTAGVGSHGYGAFYPENRKQQVLAPRFALGLTLAPWPGAHTLHSCDNRICVNPGHLRWGTHAENMRDMALRGRAKPGRTLPPECSSGHSYTPENTLTKTRKGRHGKQYTVRVCRECNRLYLARRRALQTANQRGNN